MEAPELHFRKWIGLARAAVLVVVIGLMVVQAFESDIRSQVLADTVSPAMLDTHGRVTERLWDANATLEFAAPTLNPDSQRKKVSNTANEDLSEIERRLWIALALKRTPQATELLYGGADGQFVSLREPRPGHFRIGRLAGAGEIRPAAHPAGARAIDVSWYPTSYDPRERPWYRFAVNRRQPTWIPPYADFKSAMLRQALAKPVYRADGRLQGVVAIELDLDHIADLLVVRSLPKAATGCIVNELGIVLAHKGGQSPAAICKTLSSSMGLSRQGSLPVGASDSFAVRVEGVNYWGGTQQVSGPHGVRWHLLVAAPRSTLVLQWLLHIGEVMVAIAAGLAFFATVALLMTRHHLRKIRNLGELVTMAVAEDAVEAIQLQGGQQLAHLKEKLNRRLRTDSLTGVMNRETFVAQVRARSANPELFEPTQFTLLFIDLNGFKAVNDAHGHKAGDEVLQTSAQRLKHALRREDAIGRFGGDEFVIYLHGVIAPHEVERFCSRLQQALATPIRLQAGMEVKIGGAIGSARYPADGEDFDVLMAIADQRMYENKRAIKEGAQVASANRPDLSVQMPTAKIEPVKLHARRQPRIGIFDANRYYVTRAPERRTMQTPSPDGRAATASLRYTRLKCEVIEKNHASAP